MQPIAKEGRAMFRGYIWATITCFVLATAAPAQVAGQFRWQRGQILTYQVEHNTSATDTVGGNKSESKTKLNLTKRWLVLDVDATGVATLQLSLLALRLEVTTPSGGTLLFDSGAPDKSDEHMREELGKFLGQPLAVLRLDTRGRLIEVKESKHGPASRYEVELPFLIMLPEDGPKTGQEWDRAYKITLDPPQGTGDKFDAVQKYSCKSVTDNQATLVFTTTLKTMPEGVLDRVPLLQLQPEGEVIFDLKSGRLQSGSLRIEKELTGHQGDGSSYKFQSIYTEKYVEGK
jgi:hypothetical protein